MNTASNNQRMLQSLNLPIYEGSKEAYGGWEGLAAVLSELGLDGIEGIWAGEDIPEDFPKALLTGYHLTFFPDWLDFYRADKDALVRKYGSLDATREFYGGEEGPETFLKYYRDDLARAQELGADYVVFHVSDVSVEEGYTYRWLHSDEEVLDASIEVINNAIDDRDLGFDFLVENQWWPGFTFRDAEKTARLLDGIRHSRKGIMLDTGHLMNTDWSIRNQQDGVELIKRCLREHGELAGFVKGLHLHQSVSGAYARKHCGALPENFPKDCFEAFGVSYGHIQKIDRHRPWTNPAVAEVIEMVGPKYLTHELGGGSNAARHRAVKRQMTSLRKGNAKLKR